MWDKKHCNKSPFKRAFVVPRREMVLNGMHFGKNEFYEIIRKLGRLWNDFRERPLFCLMKSSKNYLIDEIHDRAFKEAALTQEQEYESTAETTP